MDVSPPFDPKCPCCGHLFSLADLRRMAVGDGFDRLIWIAKADGSRQAVSFDEYNPATMTPAAILPRVAPKQDQDHLPLAAGISAMSALAVTQPADR
jgi:hypothetical protein